MLLVSGSIQEMKKNAPIHSEVAENGNIGSMYEPADADGPGIAPGTSEYQTR